MIVIWLALKTYYRCIAWQTSPTTILSSFLETGVWSVLRKQVSGYAPAISFISGSLRRSLATEGLLFLRSRENVSGVQAAVVSRSRLGLVIVACCAERRSLQMRGRNAEKRRDAITCLPMWLSPRDGNFGKTYATSYDSGQMKTRWRANTSNAQQA